MKSLIINSLLSERQLNNIALKVSGNLLTYVSLSLVFSATITNFRIKFVPTASSDQTLSEHVLVSSIPTNIFESTTSLKIFTNVNFLAFVPAEINFKKYHGNPLVITQNLKNFFTRILSQS